MNAPLWASGGGCHCLGFARALLADHGVLLLAGTNRELGAAKEELAAEDITHEIFDDEEEDEDRKTLVLPPPPDTPSTPPPPDTPTSEQAE